VPLEGLGRTFEQADDAEMSAAESIVSIDTKLNSAASTELATHRPLALLVMNLKHFM
jgi:hypothetical protein